VDNSVSANHLLSEQVDHEQGCVALRAVTAQADGASKEMALRAATLADETFATSGAFVDRSRHHPAATLKFLA